jgi:hypothetical protein
VACQLRVALIDKELLGPAGVVGKWVELRGLSLNYRHIVVLYAEQLCLVDDWRHERRLWHVAVLHGGSRRLFGAKLMCWRR